MLFGINCNNTIEDRNQEEERGEERRGEERGRQERRGEERIYGREEHCPPETEFYRAEQNDDDTGGDYQKHPKEKNPL